MMLFAAVAGKCLLLSEVVTGGLPQLCPSEISERAAPRACRTSGAFGKRRGVWIRPIGTCSWTSVMSDDFG
jgi:hypothetical protein